MNLKLTLPIYIIAALLLGSCEKVSDGSSDGMKADSASGAVSPGGNGTAGVITAGEWNDNENWGFWKTLMQKDTIKDLPGAWRFYPSNRVSVVLKDAAGKLLHDATISIQYNGASASAKTDNSGKAVLFAGLHEPGISLTDFTLTAVYNSQSFNLGSFSNDGNIIYKTIPVTKSVTSNLDIMFVVDATGSMGDEITYLKTELLDVINRAGSQLPGVQLNMGSVFYKDHGDDYVTRPFGFTTSAQQVVNFINNQSADGGGDYPEAVDEALQQAIQNMQWSSKAVNRLLFIVLDAPPHETAENLNRLQAAVKVAQEKGIRIIPVSASGVDRQTEFLLRSMSIGTNSTYVFITNHSGVGNPHLTPTVGNYTVEFLNNLMVRLITKYGKNND